MSKNQSNKTALVPAYLKPPKEENDLARQMKAVYLQLPPNERTDKRIAEMFGKSELTVMRYRRSFGWEAEAAKRAGNAAVDPFLIKHHPEIEQGNEEFFYLTRELIRKEFERLGLKWDGEKVIRLAEDGLVETANAEARKVLKGKDYKELLNLFELWVKTIHGRNPNQAKQSDGSGPKLSIEKAVIEIHYD